MTTVFIDGQMEHLDGSWMEFRRVACGDAEVSLWFDGSQAVVFRQAAGGRMVGARVPGLRGEVPSLGDSRVRAVWDSMMPPVEVQAGPEVQTEAEVIEDNEESEANRQHDVTEEPKRLAASEEFAEQEEAAEDNLPPFARVYARLVDSDLTTTARLVALAVARHLGRHDGRYVTFVGPGRLAEELHLGCSTVYHALAAIERAGIFRVIRGGSTVHGTIRGRSFRGPLFIL